MLSVQKWKCSWALFATIASILALVSIVHLFLFPIVPTFDYFKQARNYCIQTNGSAEKLTGQIRESLQPHIDLDHQFPADLHHAAAYRGAPWKADIGQWLSGCDSITEQVKILEIVGGSSCKNDCTGKGVCNRELGECRCFHGFTGEGCSERLNLSCNHPASPELPYGRWVVSICPAYCDTTKAMCFCGEGTKYPNRPVAEACGFQVKNA